MPAIRPIFDATPRSKTTCGSATNAWRAGATYSDPAISGSTRLRPGCEKLLEDARKGEFDVVVAEALDRPSRNQEDVTSLYKHLGFVGVRLLTLAEGESGAFARCRNSASWTRSYGMRRRRGSKRSVRLRLQEHTQTEAARRELGRIDRDLNKLVQALLDGVPATSVKAKMERLEIRKIGPTAGLVAAEAPSPLLHPGMAEIYHRKVADLNAALNADDVTRVEATGILRSLIDAIVLVPTGAELKIELRGDLAGILNVATKEKSPSFTDGLVSQVEVVAGTCNQRDHKKWAIWI